MTLLAPFGVGFDTAMLIALLLPMVGAVLIVLAGRWPNLRETITLATAVGLFIVVLHLLGGFLAGEAPRLMLLEVVPGIPLALKLEPLGMIFALVASGLWIITSLYAIGYMRGNNEKHQTRFYACFAIALGASMGIAFADNLFTLFIFYEVLTLSTYPLVAHKETEEAKRGARIYLGILLATSIGLLLPAIIWTYAIAGTGDFVLGGILAGNIESALVPILLALYMFGIGKAALVPIHPWLPSAMVAPTPVSALLHAVAVVKAGVFTVLKVTVYIFGTDFLADTQASVWIMWIAAFSIVFAGIIAMTKDNLKARLAYSTVSQLSYVTLGAMLASGYGITAGALQIMMHATAKITLFMCAGAIYVATHKTELSEMDGLGRRMPWVYGAFTIGALAIIGIPPLGGDWVKLYLVMAATDSGHEYIIYALIAASLLSIGYLLPVVARGFFGNLGNRAEPAPVFNASAPKEDRVRAHPLTVIAPVITAGLCLLTILLVGPLKHLIEPIVGTH
ncbi:monovalent cation/H+ antiporter subunit D family protein [Pyruvatibacter sp.]|uniref:monovalent cation/H+ antiporter subunit D family protein n=1 Tax=Pyruvatibacter sp. TaxID=1981328 RepID=UPI0032F08C1B